MKQSAAMGIDAHWSNLHGYLFLTNHGGEMWYLLTYVKHQFPRKSRGFFLKISMEVADERHALPWKSSSNSASSKAVNLADLMEGQVDKPHLLPSWTQQQ